MAPGGGRAREFDGPRSAEPRSSAGALRRRGPAGPRRAAPFGGRGRHGPPAERRASPPSPPRDAAASNLARPLARARRRPPAAADPRPRPPPAPARPQARGGAGPGHRPGAPPAIPLPASIGPGAVPARPVPLPAGPRRSGRAREGPRSTARRAGGRTVHGAHGALRAAPAHYHLAPPAPRAGRGAGPGPPSVLGGARLGPAPADGGWTSPAPGPGAPPAAARCARIAGRAYRRGPDRGAAAPAPVPARAGPRHRPRLPRARSSLSRQPLDPPPAEGAASAAPGGHRGARLRSVPPRPGKLPVAGGEAGRALRGRAGAGG